MLRLSEPATVKVTITRKRAGRFRAFRVLRTPGPVTSASLRLLRPKLVPGAYRATVVVTDAAGNASASRRIGFVVVAPVSPPPPPAAPVVLYEERDGIALVTLDRPAALNAIDADVLDGLAYAPRPRGGRRERACGDRHRSGHRLLRRGGHRFPEHRVPGPRCGRWRWGGGGEPPHRDAREGGRRGHQRGGRRRRARAGGGVHAARGGAGRAGRAPRGAGLGPSPASGAPPGSRVSSGRGGPRRCSSRGA